MLVLDTPAATATIVDANDTARAALAPFAGAAALRKGALVPIYRTPTSIFYQVVVADGAGHLLSQLVEFPLAGPTPPPGTVNVGTLAVSHSAASLVLTCNGKYIVTCGDGATPVSAISVATGEEISTLTLANNVSNVFCADDGVSVLAVEADEFGAGLGVRRLSISAEGQLADTAEFLSLPGASTVKTVPGTGFGVVLNRTPMLDFANAFTLAGMTLNNSVPLVGETADSLTIPCDGTKAIVRSNITGAPIEAASLIEVFAFDTTLGTLSLIPAPSFTVAAAPTGALPGENHVNVTSDGTLIAAVETSGVRLYSSTDGSFVREFVPAGLSAGDISLLACCQLNSPATAVAEQRIAGPDVDSNMIIDTEIPVRGLNPSAYTFKIDLTVASPVPSLVVEQVGPAWEVVTVTPDVPGDQVFRFPGFIGGFFNLPTYVIWIPSENNGSLTFEIRTRQNFFPPNYQPNVAGTVPQTVGAMVLNVGFQPVIDENGNPLVGTAFDVTAVVIGNSD